MMLFDAEDGNSSNLSLVLLGFLIQALGQWIAFIYTLQLSSLAQFPEYKNRSFSCHSAFFSQYVKYPHESSSQREIRRYGFITQSLICPYPCSLAII